MRVMLLKCSALLTEASCFVSIGDENVMPITASVIGGRAYTISDDAGSVIGAL